VEVRLRVGQEVVLVLKLVSRAGGDDDAVAVTVELTQAPPPSSENTPIPNP
jgi:hypothetical protein